MKRLLILLIVVSLLTGCGMKYPEMDSDAVGFELGSYIDKNDDDAAYSTIEYNGRTYMAYSSLKQSIKEKDLDKCIGYVIQDGKEDKDTRIYTLADDKDHNFLMQYYVVSNWMNQPTFYRAIDTKGKDINIPKFINEPDGKYWE